MKSLLLSILLGSTCAFVVTRSSAGAVRHRHKQQHRSTSGVTVLAEKAAPLISGEELEKLLVDMDQPLVVDAYATW